MKGIFGINVLHAIARHKERKKETVKCLFLSSEDRKTNMEVVIKKNKKNNIIASMNIILYYII